MAMKDYIGPKSSGAKALKKEARATRKETRQGKKAVKDTFQPQPRMKRNIPK